MQVSSAVGLKGRVWRAMLAFTLIACALLVAVGSAHAAFPGQNGKIVFNPGGIYTINPDGSDRKFLINGAYPSWSADGTKIVFVFATLDKGPGVYVMNADGSGVAQVVAEDDPGWPTWAPDGKHIVYQTGPFCHTDECFAARLWIVGADGSGRTQLGTYGGGSADAPEFSPDGERIAFWKWDLCCHTFPPDDSGIFTMKLDASGRALLAKQGFYPSWSPDGARLAFGSGIEYDPSTGHFNQLPLSVVGADGSGLSGLGSLPGNHPAWSPDGTKIAFASATGSCGSTFVCRSDIYIMNSDGSNPVRITDGNELIRTLDWQPIPEPQRSDYKNAAQFCQADRDFLGDEAFGNNYGTNGNGANAYGKCVSQNR
jgi:WD40-like Beta Propeller Repeat